MFTVAGLAPDRIDGRFDIIIDQLLNYILNNLGHHHHIVLGGPR